MNTDTQSRKILANESRWLQIIAGGISGIISIGFAFAFSPIFLANFISGNWLVMILGFVPFIFMLAFGIGGWMLIFRPKWIAAMGEKID